MRRRLGRDDFSRTRELALAGRQGSGTRWWKVCQAYELREQPLIVDDYYGAHHCLVPKYPDSQEDKWRRYNPLEDTPDLFLRFARLYNKEGVLADAMLNWVHKYGLLYGGLSYGGDNYSEESEETLANYRGSIHWAAGILAMYEAALNSDKEAAKDAVLGEFLWVGATTSELRKFSEQEYAARRADSVEEIWDGNYLEYALDTAVSLVNLTVQEECSPGLRLPEGASDPSDVGAVWLFKSLHGAMYLQMYWLMAAGGDVTRCKY